MKSVLPTGTLVALPCEDITFAASRIHNSASWDKALLTALAKIKQA